MTKLDLYKQDPTKIAQQLLGSSIISTIDNKTTSGIIVETEAYLSENDAAAHNVRGMTEANKSLYEDAGTIYVHSLRQHFLIDLVVGKINNPSSILIRAIEPIDGIDIMEHRRVVLDKMMLCNGPGKLCKALGITKEIDGWNIFEENSPIKINFSGIESTKSISKSSRIGISKNKTAPLRFYLTNNKFVSRF